MKKIEQSEALQKLQEQVKGVFNIPENHRDPKVEVRESGDEIHVEVSQMYEHLPLTFDTLMKLSEVFGTKEFTVNQWGHGGCETCDYGSCYAHEFSYKKAV